MTAGFMTSHICHLGICTYHGSLTSRETLTNQVRPSVLHQFHNTRVYSVINILPSLEMWKADLWCWKRCT